MNVSDLFIGSLSTVFSSSCVIIVLFMMLMVCSRMLFSRRKKAYLSLSISLAVIIAQYILIIALQVWSRNDNGTTDYIGRVLQVISFLLINMGIYQLYNASKKKHHLLFYCFLWGTVIIAALHFYTLHNHPNPSAPFILLQNIWIELYLFVLIFLCFYMVSPFIGQHVKYQTALTVYFIIQIAHTINTFVLDKPNSFLMFIQNFMPVLYYFIIFLFLFERVLELLQATYKSSITDALTRLYNRRYFINRVALHVNRHIQTSLLFFDIDNFKKLNDTKGHQTGDDMLRKVAGILQEECEDKGVSGRYGGEELVVLLTNPSDKAEQVAEHIRKRVEEETIVTVSVGFCKYKKGMSVNDYMKMADQAMYQSKTTGKNKVTGAHELKRPR